jgi:hypothetical protein
LTVIEMSAAKKETIHQERNTKRTWNAKHKASAFNKVVHLDSKLPCLVMESKSELKQLNRVALKTAKAHNLGTKVVTFC